MKIKPEIRDMLKTTLEKVYPLYNIDSFDVSGNIGDVFVLQNIKLLSKQKGMGELIPMMIAPSSMLFAGVLIKI